MATSNMNPNSLRANSDLLAMQQNTLAAARLLINSLPEELRQQLADEIHGAQPTSSEQSGLLQQAISLLAVADGERLPEAEVIRRLKSAQPLLSGLQLTEAEYEPLASAVLGLATSTDQRLISAELDTVVGETLGQVEIEREPFQRNPAAANYDEWRIMSGLPAPTDDEIDQWIYEWRMTKYGTEAPTNPV